MYDSPHREEMDMPDRRKKLLRVAAVFGVSMVIVGSFASVGGGWQKTGGSYNCTTAICHK
jgi:hypothetical protein